MASVEFCGEMFELVVEPSEFALMEWSEAAEDVESSSVAALAATMRLARDCIVPADHARFRAVGRKSKASAEMVLPIIMAAFEQVTERPTSLPADSSDGQQVTEVKSGGVSSSPAVVTLPGRPDLMLAQPGVREMLSA